MRTPDTDRAVRSRPRRWAVLLVGALVLGSFFWTLRRELGLELSPASVQATVASLGMWGPLVFVAIVAFRVPLGVPSAFALIGGGLVFGLLKGTLYGATGLVISAIVVFLGARWAGRSALESRVPPRLRPVLDAAGSRVGAVFIALGTAYPLSPITSCHLAAGVTGMGFGVFLVAATLGCLGRAALYTYFGDSLVEADPRRLLLAGALVLAAVVLPLLLPAPRQWLVHAIGRRRPS